MGTAHSRALVQIEQHSFINRLGYESENIKATNFLFFCYNVKEILLLNDSLACLLSYSQSCLSRVGVANREGTGMDGPAEPESIWTMEVLLTRGCPLVAQLGPSLFLKTFGGDLNILGQTPLGFPWMPLRTSLDPATPARCQSSVRAVGVRVPTALFALPHQGSARGLRWGLLPPAQGRTSLTGLLPGGGGLW